MTPPDLQDEAARLHTVWRELGIPGVVDVHTHFMPANVLAKVWAYFDSAGPLLGRPWPVAYREDEDARVARLRAYGVQRFTSLLYPHKPGMGAWLNEWAADFAARTPDCLHSATFFPEPEAGEYVGAALRSGARVFKAHVQVGAYDPSDPLLDPVWEQLEEAGTPVVIHCASGPRPGAHTGPGPVREVLRRFPRLTLVVAHMGLPEYTPFLELAETHERVHLDTTMAFTDFGDFTDPGDLDLPRLAGLQDRILLGTDFPNIPYPYLHQVEALVRLGLGDDWLRAVLRDNAVRLLDL
ncbi:amidohydrolase family protein [Nocardioides marmoribigeumensis]|uniref:TIM-barrel fold metal-dependent hydrolase n=1 Tax=Nocardioides marmoribigeumensis TaxID=433649 RepID=A0ABU2C0D3_9ACTN|nr:amidohydrolase family protein [Nocardioides marmoribigeumensis]MDR7364103.1 putative TIM-barrel fold metal-dependent hydrolase [Nocardioides marmoribigeumensis]